MGVFIGAKVAFVSKFGSRFAARLSGDVCSRVRGSSAYLEDVGAKRHDGGILFERRRRSPSEGCAAAAAGDQGRQTGVLWCCATLRVRSERGRLAEEW